jgi:hypothetical protein
MIGTLLTWAVDATPCDNAALWVSSFRAVAAEYADPFERAIRGGFEADRVGWAFCAGYQAALCALIPSLRAGTIAAFCVTEEEGNHPRNVRTALERSRSGGLVLNGEKHWATLASDARLFLVVARDAQISGPRPALRLTQVPAGAPNIALALMPATRFIPEVPHGRIAFRNVELPSDAACSDDAFERYVRPFRTVEDIYVRAAVLAYLVREARRFGWPETWIEQALLALSGLRSLARDDPSVAATHVALAGALSVCSGLFARADSLWTSSPDKAAGARWRRDREVLVVASAARTQRREKAWERLRPTSEP